jgi:hypothetical protein
MLKELSGRNESKPHQMSSETETTGKPSRYPNGEGRHAASSNRQKGTVDSGGVSEGDTTGRETKVSWDISGGGATKPQPSAQGGVTSEAGRASREVGVFHSYSLVCKLIFHKSYSPIRRRLFFRSV